jgi:hypothetical protein
MVADSAVGKGEGEDPSKTTAKSGPLPLLYSLYAHSLVDFLQLPSLLEQTKKSSKMYLFQCLMRLSESVYRVSEEGYKKDLLVI